MALTKDKHYWTQLRTAITAGQWDSDLPGKDTKGVTLNWANLLRKFNKHCPGHNEFAEVVSQTQYLYLQLSAGQQKPTADGFQCLQTSPFDLDDEIILPQERQQEGQMGYDMLKAIPSPSESAFLALAYYAYSLSRPSESLDILSKVKDLTHPLKRIPTINPSSNVSHPSADYSSSWTGGFSTAEHNHVNPDVKDGRAWLFVETVRSVCLKGMSYEKLHPSDLQGSLDIYLSASILIDTLESEIPRTVPTIGSPNPQPSSYTQYLELWRWVEQLLWRTVVIAVRISTDEQMLSALFRQYFACSSHWDPSFRSQHRSTVSTLYLHFVISQAKATKIPGSELDTPSWLPEARSVIQEYKSVLNVSTKFPRAGERNVLVEEFVDLCVATWEASGAIGEHAGWVLDTLWWATRLTFNSHRIFRHMSRLFYVSGDSNLAIRTLRLYVQVVGKAWETAKAEVDQRPEDRSTSSAEIIPGADTDRNWVQTLVQGARMFCRVACSKSGTALGTVGNGLDEAREAGALIEKAKTRLDANNPELAASVYLAEGIWHSVMAHKEQMSFNRPYRLSESLRLCELAVETFPSAPACYHLALALSRAGPSRNIPLAIEHARFAVEQGSHEIRHWHLLGLLLVATDDWKKAKAILEYGAGIGEERVGDEGLPQTPNGDTPGTPNGQIEGLPPTAPPFMPVLKSSSTLLDPDAIGIPPAASLLKRVLDHPPPSRRELFEQALQLRMTQLALSEHAEGTEGAVEKWLEVFTWVATQKEGNQTARSSFDSTQKSGDQGSMSNQTISARPGTLVDVTVSGVEDVPSAEPPITVTPASPLRPSFEGQSRQGENVDGRNKLSLGRPRGQSSAGRKVSKILKTQVHRGQERISSISKIVAFGPRHGLAHLRKATSAPDFHSVLSISSYQASSIHSRRRVTYGNSTPDEPVMETLPPRPPPPVPVPQKQPRWDSRAAKGRRLMSDLWCMSAATFRRFGKIEQARGAIQEAEVRDGNNPAVWVQLGLYYHTLGDEQKALQALHKALFIEPEHVSAIIHICRIYLSPPGTGVEELDPDRVELAAGLLSDLTNGHGWDVPEAWYYLAKAAKMQGRTEMERECLTYALRLAEVTRVREIPDAVGWSL
ncbi:hypothetical protein BJ322DRAFT_1182415 [Thelephora terrestris]|uniref:TPR-like protein n=1 Tax=Thelephora terrestris TaxID=56493 RepID=A0A9P6HKW7_9AGAM|nr:hypothetical protein BJ322DRAFT_1182415 [Thelephora terrestris]